MRFRSSMARVRTRCSEADCARSMRPSSTPSTTSPGYADRSTAWGYWSLHHPHHIGGSITRATFHPSRTGWTATRIAASTWPSSGGERTASSSSARPDTTRCGGSPPNTGGGPFRGRRLFDLDLLPPQPQCLPDRCPTLSSMRDNRCSQRTRDESSSGSTKSRAFLIS